MQTTDTVLMISPSQFGFNEQTAESNSFQNKSLAIAQSEIQNLALAEFQSFANTLRNNGIEVIEFQDYIPALSPDSIFPNNWFSTHSEGKILTYPMLTDNRRRERRVDIRKALMESYNYEHISLEHLEDKNPPSILEGTGSLVLDRENKIAYAVLSERTSLEGLEEFKNRLGYEICSFRAYGSDSKSLYHTNVLMVLGEDFVAIGMENIHPEDQEMVLGFIAKSEKALIPLKPFQINYCFAGNMLQLRTRNGERVLVLSQSAFSSLNPLQMEELMKYNDKLLPIGIPTIEMFGGGSVRCMMAEIFK